MILGFKPQFVPFVEDHSKTHTIRAPRKDRPIRIGDRLDCYANVRQKSMRLLGRWTCTRVQDIKIGFASGTPRLAIVIDGIALNDDEALLFAHRDGFRGDSPLQEMEEFWKRHHAISFDKPFRGHLIHWNPKEVAA